MIIKNEIPLLEFDTNPTAVLMPTHEHLDLHLPEKAVFAFLGEHIDDYARTHRAVVLGTFESTTKNYPIYAVEYGGETVCLCQAPVGAAPAAQLMDWLIGYGVRKIITGGCCGALSDFAENQFLIPYRALRDEGTSYHYMKPSRFVDIHPAARAAIAETLTAHGLDYKEIITWSTDGFYRETREKVLYRRAEGCEAVEMECSALAACAALRNAVWGCLLFTADTLADIENYDERGWGEDSFAVTLELCLDAVLKL